MSASSAPGSSAAPAAAKQKEFDLTTRPATELPEAGSVADDIGAQLAAAEASQSTDAPPAPPAQTKSTAIGEPEEPVVVETTSAAPAPEAETDTDEVEEPPPPPRRVVTKPVLEPAAKRQLATATAGGGGDEPPPRKPLNWDTDPLDDPRPDPVVQTSGEGDQPPPIDPPTVTKDDGKGKNGNGGGGGGSPPANPPATTSRTATWVGLALLILFCLAVIGGIYLWNHEERITTLEGAKGASKSDVIAALKAVQSAKPADTTTPEPKKSDAVTPDVKKEEPKPASAPAPEAKKSDEPVKSTSPSATVVMVVDPSVNQRLGDIDATLHDYGSDLNDHEKRLVSFEKFRDGLGSAAKAPTPPVVAAPAPVCPVSQVDIDACVAFVQRAQRHAEHNATPQVDSAVRNAKTYPFYGNVKGMSHDQLVKACNGVDAQFADAFLKRCGL